jgi:hypothetical protein
LRRGPRQAILEGMSGGPLTDERLGAVEACLNDGRLEEAQQKLVALGGEAALGPGVSYLTTKLLFLRGRLDSESVRDRLQEVIAECPEFPEAETLLRITSPPPRPTVPAPTIPAEPPSDLGTLAPPRSELPTEPAPPPGEDSLAPALIVPGRPLSDRPPLWPELELELGFSGAAAAMVGLERLAAKHLDQLLVREVPGPRRVALESMNFFTSAPISNQFAPFDLSLKSLDRMDAFLSMLGAPSGKASPTALTILAACYAGECVRATRGGTWEGRVTEPEHLAVAYGDDRYAPLSHATAALGGAFSLRASAGPPLHPGAEPPDPCSHRGADPPSPWDPMPWPELHQMTELGRAFPTSAIGTWASRVLGIPLDRTPRSAEAIRRYLALVRPSPEGPSGKTERRAAVFAGAYLGELVCLHRAGRWNETDAAPEGPLRYEVLLPDGSGVYPVLLCHDEVTGSSKRDFGHAVHLLLGR